MQKESAENIAKQWHIHIMSDFNSSIKAVILPDYFIITIIIITICMIWEGMNVMAAFVKDRTNLWVVLILKLTLAKETELR